MESKKVLVACPTNVIKKYAMRSWIDNVKSFEYDNWEVYMVDNSPSDAFSYNYKDEIHIDHIKTDQQLAHLRITQSMEVIRRYAVNGNFDYWLNLEIDVIPLDKDVIHKMVNFAETNKLDLVNHCYPARWKDYTDHQGIGFSIISKNLFSTVSFANAGNVSPDGFMWGKVRVHTQYKMADIWNIFPVKHMVNS